MYASLVSAFPFVCPGTALVPAGPHLLSTTLKYAFIYGTNRFVAPNVCSYYEFVSRQKMSNTLPFTSFSTKSA